MINQLTNYQIYLSSRCLARFRTTLFSVELIGVTITVFGATLNDILQDPVKDNTETDKHKAYLRLYREAIRN